MLEVGFALREACGLVARAGSVVFDDVFDETIEMLSMEYMRE